MQRKPLVLALAACGLLNLSAHANAAGRANAIGLGNLGTNSSGVGSSFATGLNASGQVAGKSGYYVGGVYQGNRAFLWSNGTMTNLGSLGTNASGNGYSYAVALNASGQVAGMSDYYLGGLYQDTLAFLWSNGTMTNVGSLGTNALNPAGQVAGASAYYVGSAYKGDRAFLWSDGAMTNLGTLGTDPGGWGSSNATALNSSGQVAGNSGYYVGGTSRGNRAFLWSNGTMTNLGSLGTNSSGYGASTSTALNASGQVAGDSHYYAGSVFQGTRAFLWSNGTMTNLGSLGTNSSGFGYSTSTALNASGQVTGDSEYYVGGVLQGTRAFLWSNGTMTNLGALGTGSGGATSSFATALNDTGQVVGRSTAIATSDYHAFLWNAGKMHDLNAFAPAGWVFKDAVAINAWGQVAGNGTHNGNSEAFLFTPHPDWVGGDGFWADASRWNYAGMGAFGFTPGEPHDVVIAPAGSATVLGATSSSVHSLSVFGRSGQIVTFDLFNGATTTKAGTTLGANAVLAGTGRLGGDLVVTAGGRVNVGAGQIMQLTGGTVTNDGQIRVVGAGAFSARLEAGSAIVNGVGGQITVQGGEASFGGKVSSQGQINLRNAIVAFTGGLANQGQMNVSFGVSDISGPIENQAGGRIVVSNGAQASFWDAIVNNGELRVSTGGAANFFGLVSGAGSFTGTGASRFEGGFAPGNSPALVTLAFDATFASTSPILMELGGTSPGNGPHDHDKVVFNGAVTLEGGDLNVVWWNGYAGHAGDTYDLFDWNGGLTGAFGHLNLPALGGGLVWHTEKLYSSGEISVAAVPEPETYAMFLAGLGLMAAAARRRRAG